MAKDSSANGNGKNGEEKRVPFKRGERERHLEALAKNMLLERQLKAKLKRCHESIELCVEDLEKGGYMDDPQPSIPGFDDSEGSPEARS